MAGALALALGCGAAMAESWKTGASVSVRETYTDNVALSSTGSRQSDWITEIGPRFTLRGAGARLKAAFNYSISEVIHANDSSRNFTNNTLGANANAELVEKFLFLDARVELFRGVTLQHGHSPLENNRTRIRALIHIMHRTAGDFDAAGQRLLPSFQTRKGRQ